jgi:glutaredoxin
MITQIEVQYFDGCPHAPAALELVKRFQQEHPETEAKYTKVVDDAQAAEISFRGSPSILINGKDLFGAPVPDEPHLACRFYPQGLPDYEDFIKLINP